MVSKSMISIVYLLIIYVTRANAVCGVCGDASGVLCTSFNTFQFCSNGVADGITYTCPSFTACSNSPDICGSPSTMPADCPPTCGVCSFDKRFACVNSTAFALCFGSTTPSPIMSTCAPNQYCDITVPAPPFCSNDATKKCSPSTIVPPSTAPPTSTGSTTSTTTSTTLTPTSTTMVSTASPTTPSPSSYCSQINARHKTRYAVPFPTNCMWYVYCFRNSGNLVGSYYQCPGSTLFNNVSGYCVRSTSYTCPPGL